MGFSFRMGNALNYYNKKHKQEQLQIELTIEEVKQILTELNYSKEQSLMLKQVIKDQLEDILINEFPINPEHVNIQELYEIENEQ